MTRTNRNVLLVLALSILGGVLVAGCWVAPGDPAPVVRRPTTDAADGGTSD